MCGFVLFAWTTAGGVFMLLSFFFAPRLVFLLFLSHFQLCAISLADNCSARHVTSLILATLPLAHAKKKLFPLQPPPFSTPKSSAAIS